MRKKGLRLLFSRWEGKEKKRSLHFSARRARKKGRKIDYNPLLGRESKTIGRKEE